jgi:hypothetical protein
LSKKTDKFFTLYFQNNNNFYISRKYTLNQRKTKKPVKKMTESGERENYQKSSAQNISGQTSAQDLLAREKELSSGRLES